MWTEDDIVNRQRADAAERKVERLREALKPFCIISNFDDEIAKLTVRLGCIRRARAALDELETGDE